MNTNVHINSIILFPTTKCNLNCTYCNINKTPENKSTDELLLESFSDPDYYFNFIKEYCPDKENLKDIELWGGEPTLGLDRIYPLLDKLCEYYPFFQGVSFSTNFSYKGWTDNIFTFLKYFNKYNPRTFSIKLQFSCDGPEEINDASRGQGVSKKCMENYKEFLDRVGTECPPNINLQMSLKPTMSLETVTKLQSYKKVKDFFWFFHTTFSEPVQKLNYSNVVFYVGSPNMAFPSPATTQDGKNYARFCKLVKKVCHRVFHDNLRFEPYLFTCEQCQKSLGLCYNQCGAGYKRIALMPNKYVGYCNEAIFYMNDKYLNDYNNKAETGTIVKHKISSQRMVFTQEEFKEFCDQLLLMLEPDYTSGTINLVTLITFLAACGQIDKKYIDMDNATYAARNLLTGAACLKDSYNINGSFYLYNIGNIRLLLNGALDVLMVKEEKE